MKPAPLTQFCDSCDALLVFSERQKNPRPGGRNLCDECADADEDAQQQGAAP
jgi:hypothetical protein